MLGPLSRRLLLVGLAAFFISGLSPDFARSQPSLPKPPASAAPPDDAQWTMPAKNYASTRYSELTEINVENVKNLQVAFTFSTGVNKGQEAAPLIVGTPCISSPPIRTSCTPSTSPKRARHEMEVRAEARAGGQGVACCDVVNRGAAYPNDRISSTHSTTTRSRSTRDGQGGVADQARQHQSRRDHHHGAAGGQG